MGNKYSTPATASPSAAFGRLRISDARLTQTAQQQQRRKLRQDLNVPSSPAAAGRLMPRPTSLEHLTYNNNNRATTAVVSLTEQSPLLRLESLPSSDSIQIIAAPPFMIWIGPALICALAYALYNIFIKKGSASIHPVLGGVILQFIAAIVGTVLLAFLIVKDGIEETVVYDMTGVYWAILAGVAVGTAEILSFCVSGMGVQSMQSIPIIIGGSVLFGTLLGWSALHEMLTYQGWIGVGLIAIGISLVGMDPGGAGGIHG